MVALYGGLGAGKTCFTKGIARGLGVDETVTSPTYTIVSEYRARAGGRVFPFYHIDAFRLGDEEDFESTGAAELTGGVTVIEWSERIPGFVPADALTVKIEVTGPESRLLRINVPSGGSAG